jgi:prepilin signal peptidase PulO-like enzyme (type II secretory pathway)
MITPVTASRLIVGRAPGWAAALVCATAIVVTIALLITKQPDLHRGLLGLAYLGLLTAIALHDLRTMRAPNRVVYPALAFALLGSLTLGWDDTREAWLGGLVALVVLLLLAIAGRGAMGMGDVKTGCLCGLVVGLHGVIPLVAAAFIAGGTLGVLLLLTRQRKRRDPIPFTPLLAAGTVFSIAQYNLYLWS